MRGTHKHTSNRFLKHQNEYVFEKEEDFDEHESALQQTSLIALHPKSIVNKITSPDAGMDYSLNPYQGCEHGCAYCYARPTHEYWGYNAGIDFERKILVKHNAPELLRKLFESKTWQCKPISLSGNTDCYQPIERKLKLTRQLLELFLEYRNPVGIITKNALVLRDLDLLQQLASMNLVRVAVSITTLNDSLRRILEPRTASAERKLQTISTLKAHNVPVMAMMAPIIPSLNCHEIMPLAKAVSDVGASGIGYTMVRLNGPVSEIFNDWLLRHYPDRAVRIMNQIKSVHGGKEGDSRFGKRMRGEGEVAEVIKRQFQIARTKYFLSTEPDKLDTSLFRKSNQQLSLF